MDCPICFERVPANEVAWVEHLNYKHNDNYPFYVFCAPCGKVVVRTDDRRLSAAARYCKPCDVFLAREVDLQTHYLRSLLHPCPCGACKLGFATSGDQASHQWPMCPVRRYHILQERGRCLPDQQVILHPEPEYRRPDFATSYPETCGHTRPSEPANGNTNATTYLQCRLCLKGCSSETPVVPPCGHIFCLGCISRQLDTHTKCPVCELTILQRLASVPDVATQSTRLRCIICKECCNKPVGTPCGHIFCHRCIAQELKTRTRCPTCEQAIL